MTNAGRCVLTWILDLELWTHWISSRSSAEPQLPAATDHSPSQREPQH